MSTRPVLVWTESVFSCGILRSRKKHGKDSAAQFVMLNSGSLSPYVKINWTYLKFKMDHWSGLFLSFYFWSDRSLIKDQKTTRFVGRRRSSGAARLFVLWPLPSRKISGLEPCWKSQKNIEKWRYLGIFFVYCIFFVYFFFLKKITAIGFPSGLDTGPPDL